MLPTKQSLTTFASFFKGTQPSAKETNTADKHFVQQVGKLWDSYRACSNSEIKGDLLQTLIPMTAKLSATPASFLTVYGDAQAFCGVVSSSFAADLQEHLPCFDALATSSPIAGTNEAELSQWLTSSYFSGNIACLAVMADSALYARAALHRTALERILAAQIPVLLADLFSRWLHACANRRPSSQPPSPNHAPAEGDDHSSLEGAEVVASLRSAFELVSGIASNSTNPSELASSKFLAPLFSGLSCQILPPARMDFAMLGSIRKVLQVVLQPNAAGVWIGNLRESDGLRAMLHGLSMSLPRHVARTESQAGRQPLEAICKAAYAIFDTFLIVLKAATVSTTQLMRDFEELQIYDALGATLLLLQSKEGCDAEVLERLMGCFMEFAFVGHADGATTEPDRPPNAPTSSPSKDEKDKKLGALGQGLSLVRNVAVQVQSLAKSKQTSVADEHKLLCNLVALKSFAQVVVRTTNAKVERSMVEGLNTMVTTHPANGTILHASGCFRRLLDRLPEMHLQSQIKVVKLMEVCVFRGTGGEGGRGVGTG